jgi:hypothetical protein
MRILQLPLAVVRRAIGMRYIFHLDNHCSHFRFSFSPQGQGGSSTVEAPGQTGTPRSLRPGRRVTWPRDYLAALLVVATGVAEL